jgi:hypothetical protein
MKSKASHSLALVLLLYETLARTCTISLLLYKTLARTYTSYDTDIGI